MGGGCMPIVPGVRIYGSTLKEKNIRKKEGIGQPRILYFPALQSVIGGVFTCCSAFRDRQTPL